jgi:hypothetical protein
MGRPARRAVPFAAVLRDEQSWEPDFSVVEIELDERQTPAK